jgi:hypothetical protein
MSRAAAMGEDAKFELAMAAAGRERINRPRALLVLAVVVMLVALVAAAWGLASRRSARASLTRALADQAAVETMAADWKKLLDEERDAGSEMMGKRMPDLLTQIEARATRAGLKDKPSPPRQNPQTRAGVTVTEYYYTNVKDPSLKALLEWLRLTTAEIGGLEVYSLNLRPDPNNWNMTVTFRRWERGGAG